MAQPWLHQVASQVMLPLQSTSMASSMETRLDRYGPMVDAEKRTNIAMENGPFIDGYRWLTYEFLKSHLPSGYLT